MGYQAISVFTLLSQVIIKLFCSSLCIYNTILARKCQQSILDVQRLKLVVDKLEYMCYTLVTTKERK